MTVCLFQFDYHRCFFRGWKKTFQCHFSSSSKTSRHRSSETSRYTIEISSSSLVYSSSDCHFISATLRYIKDLAGTFGNDCVFYLVQDNKGSIRIGRPVARGHTPLMLRLDYQTSTLDSTPIPPTVKYQFKPTYVIRDGYRLSFSGFLLGFMHRV